MAQSRVFNGVIWASIQRFGGLAITFVSSMVMARLLTPEDFGTIGMLLFFLAISQTLIDSGFGAALVQKKEITEADSSTVFHINMAMSLIVYVLLFTGAPLIAGFYETPVLKPLLRVMGLVVFIQAAGMIQSALLQRNMDFKPISIANLAGSVVLAATGIISALLGCGVWSLVLRTLAGAAATSIIIWALSKWRPKRVFSMESFRNLFGFGGFMMLSSLVVTISNNVQSLIIGKIFKPSALGNYTQAHNLRNLVCDGIQAVVGQVLYPEFSKYQDDDEALKRKTDDSIYMTSFVTVPLMLWMVALAAPMILLVYGNQWGDTIPLMRILCIGGIFYSIQDVNVNVVKAKGRSKVLFYVNIIKLVILTAVLIPGGVFFGLKGLMWAFTLYSLINYLIYSSLSAHYTKSNNIAQYTDILKCVVMSALPCALAFYLSTLISNNFMSAVVGSAAFWGVYLLIAWVAKAMPLRYILNMVFRNGKRN